MSEPLVVAINPMAGEGRHEHVGHRVVERLREEGHRVIGIRESSLAALEAATRAAVADGAKALIVVGGDGMVSLGLNIVAGTRLPLGIIAAGTGNDFARGIDLPVGTPEESLELLVSMLALEPRRVDLAKVTDEAGGVRWVGGALSAGFDAAVNERANQWRWPRGPSRYTIAMLWELLRLRNRRYRVLVDGVERRIEGVLITVANNTTVGGGMLIAPMAELTDGELDLFLTHRIGRIELLRTFPKVFTGRHVDHPKVEFQRGRHFRIEAEGVVGYADGERVGPLPLEVEAVPNALRVFAPLP